MNRPFLNRTRRPLRPWSSGPLPADASIARLRAVAISQSAGLAGSPAHIDRHNAARPQLGQLRGDGERPVEVVGLDEDQAAEELLAVDARAIGQQRPVFLVTYRRRRAGCVQADPAGHVPAGQDNRDAGSIGR
jgi:hypothetical protein